jgi:hypothetical protein
VGAWRILILAAALFVGARGEEKRFAVKIEVSNLPAAAEFVPVSCGIDFAAMGVKELVDERSLRLFQVIDAKEVEVPYQFSATPQPRAAKRLMTNTPGSVSYIAEFPAGEASDKVKVAGELSWIVRGASGGMATYTLTFSVPEAGRLIQTPFPPQSLRLFDEGGKGSAPRWFPIMQLHPQWPVNGVVNFREGRDPITSYHLGPALTNLNPTIRRPYFYPVIGPDGIELTEFGKPHDPTGSHAHHYSLWITHNSVSGVDYWGERGGVIAHEALDLMEDGPIFSRIIQRARWRNGGTDVLKEKRTITTYASAGDFRVMDIEMELTPASSNSVTFGKTSFGFLAARVAQSMTPFDGGGTIRTSEGKINEAGAHLTHGAWLDQSGPIAQDRRGGIAILDHPKNPRFPTGWHCRNDGWAGAAFNVDGPLTLAGGENLQLKYRVILHRHDAERAGMALRFEEWAAQPRVAVGEVGRAPRR